MYVVRADRSPAAPTAVTPHELNAEMAALLSQHNGGYDLENVTAGTIADADIADNAVHDLTYDSELTQVVVSLTVKTHQGAIMAVPDSAGDPFIVEFDTEEEAILQVTAGGSYSTTIGRVHLYVVVDGIVAAQLDSAPEDTSTTVQSFEIDGVMPIPAGGHVVEMLYGFAQEGAAASITFEDRSLLLDWVYR